MRKRDVPAGMVGGRIAPTIKPAFFKIFAASSILFSSPKIIEITGDVSVQSVVGTIVRIASRHFFESAGMASRSRVEKFLTTSIAPSAAPAAAGGK